MSKVKRQQKLLDLIKQHEIETQDELINALHSAGFNVTQATVSRDINDLQLIKVAGVTKKYRYSQEQYAKSIDNAKFLALFKAAVVSIEAAQNIVVIKTLISNANPVAATVDSLNYQEIIGSVAGDDTLLIVTRNSADAEAVVTKLNSLL